jgi:hypothetical protein
MCHISVLAVLFFFSFSRFSKRNEIYLRKIFVHAKEILLFLAKGWNLNFKKLFVIFFKNLQNLVMLKIFLNFLKNAKSPPPDFFGYVTTLPPVERKNIFWRNKRQQQILQEPYNVRCFSLIGATSNFNVFSLTQRRRSTLIY